MRAFPIAIAFVLSLSAPAFADCKEPETGTYKIPLFSLPLSEVVVGAGRLQFYAAPNLNCILTGVFVVPKDELIAYAQSNDGWTIATVDAATAIVPASRGSSPPPHW